MNEPVVFYVDDDARAGELMARFSDQAPYRCRTFQRPEQALAEARNEPPDLVITDLRMPGMDGMDLLRGLRELEPGLPVIILTGYSSVDSAVEAMREGATDFLKKPFDMDELRLHIEKTLEYHRLERENLALRRALEERDERHGMVGQAAAMEAVHEVIGKIADIRCNVIIEGESGTGKELAARAIHEHSDFADTPFVVIDCGALTDTLLESELFGHEMGAFTGAVRAKSGLLETASGGTVFLDEIGNISDAMQTKLLRVIQEQQVTPVGGVQGRAIDVRFIAASNRSLEQMVSEEAFRADLYHRLNVVNLRMPPLRERPEDIPVLVEHFVREFASRYGRTVSGFDADSMAALVNHPWPGNVRELRNTVERSIALADGETLRFRPAPGDGAETPGGQRAGAREAAMLADTPTLAELERRYILQVLDDVDGSRERAAALLGINKTTLWRRLQRYAASDA
ncbi:MAG: sigma-54-dependent transcriptional regulator [Pseudomonadota bacterium]